MVQNKTLIFKKSPVNYPVAGEHLVIEDRGFDAEAAAPNGGITIEVLSASFDPYLRGRMRDARIESYMPAFEMNGPVVNNVAARVLKSDSANFKAGDFVVAFTAIAEYNVILEAAIGSVKKINNPHNLPLDLFLGPLGMPGLTAWAGLYKIGKPKKGETIFVSSAAGAVGQVVGQIAKHEGLRVVGSVGSDEKLDFITKELGFDGGFNYKKEKPADGLKRVAPEGIHIYFENVGGEHLEAALDHIHKGGRIPTCGMIGDYNTPQDQRYGVRNMFHVVAKTLEMVGFLVGKPGYGDVYYQEHQEKMQQWLAEGTFKPKMHVTEGIDNAAEGLIGIFKGENFGKAVVKIKDL
ncbi:hypothetical protein BJ166DRAFT_563955 [Pestalotiopsis sp. NC0098]|nr:hypothetical protein BJ166DRAFT_563955 [Pestalotiopsis sp. NC0098]